MVSKFCVLVALVLGMALLGCSSSDEAAVQEGPKASDLKEVAGAVSSGTQSTEQPAAKGPRNPKVREGR